ncbi:alpha/beta fold hydrolase [Rhodococcus spelaei]|uniref:Alpha/beta fold hydrolase n=1 Tax=Rhodococcus spelaei TaxID=2546320 RepID=A0A541BP04_9NOCA|nr:alpha/beta fold hydrolase [Rhodococcus spelaei]TQF74061.1 alpha/beta fold hydrolase [Rhodococcus spelaei]
MADTEITFTSGDVTLHGSLRLPADAPGPVPAALLLAGSGPTDRNGDSAVLPGPIGTLRFLADTLEQAGIASLRYDKLGSGETGLGPYDVEDVAGLGFSVFVDAAADALKNLAAQPDIDADRLLVIGHSEGALVAMALAVREGTPTLVGLGLLEPLAVRLLDLLTRQIAGQVDAAVAGGQLPLELADQLRTGLTDAVESLRADATVPDDLPEPLRLAGLVSVNAKALAEEDALDPQVLAAQLPAGLPVLTSCSARDIQVDCGDVAALDTALGASALTSIRMTTANHVLKEIGERVSTGADYVEDLPFSAEFAAGFENWLAQL